MLGGLEIGFENWNTKYIYIYIIHVKPSSVYSIFDQFWLTVTIHKKNMINNLVVWTWQCQESDK